ncbi:MAG: hypothetical protein DRN12_05790 [Thermoplasmata archaeon]|nr:MAG: hypothetical protein DRN12_05790 [Thermoplasmata archaeon]
METKGIAVRVDKELFDKIENHSMSRNELIEKAVKKFLEEDENDIPEEVYDQVYSTLYQTEVRPLKQKIEHQKYIIQILERQIEEYRADKEFLKQQILELCRKRGFLSRFRRRKSIDNDLE